SRAQERIAVASAKARATLAERAHAELQAAAAAEERAAAAETAATTVASATAAEAATTTEVEVVERRALVDRLVAENAELRRSLEREEAKSINASELAAAPGAAERPKSATDSVYVGSGTARSDDDSSGRGSSGFAQCRDPGTATGPLPPAPPQSRACAECAAWKAAADEAKAEAARLRKRIDKAEEVAVSMERAGSALGQQVNRLDETVAALRAAAAEAADTHQRTLQRAERSAAERLTVEKALRNRLVADLAACRDRLGALRKRQQRQHQLLRQQHCERPQAESGPNGPIRRKSAIAAAPVAAAQAPSDKHDEVAGDNDGGNDGGPAADVDNESLRSRRYGSDTSGAAKLASLSAVSVDIGAPLGLSGGSERDGGGAGGLATADDGFASGIMSADIGGGGGADDAPVSGWPSAGVSIHAGGGDNGIYNDGFNTCTDGGDDGSGDGNAKDGGGSGSASSHAPRPGGSGGSGGSGRSNSAVQRQRPVAWEVDMQNPRRRPLGDADPNQEEGHLLTLMGLQSKTSGRLRLSFDQGGVD
ncbi:unnamed protein product, partial [Phaeothamnion confervicola]